MKVEIPPHLGRLCRRLLKLGWPLAPTYHLEEDEINELAFGSDRKLIAWAVPMKLDPPPQLSDSAKALADFLARQTPIYDREIMKDIRPTNSWIGMVETAPFK